MLRQRCAAVLLTALVRRYFRPQSDTRVDDTSLTVGCCGVAAPVVTNIDRHILIAAQTGVQ